MWLVGAVAQKSQTSSWRGRALIACIALLALLLGGASWFATVSAQEREKAEASRSHAIEVLQTADEIEIAALNAIRGERGYLLTGDARFLEPLEIAKPAGSASTARLIRLVEDSPAQAALSQGVDRKFNGLIKRVESIVSLHDEGKHSEALNRVGDGEDRQAIEAIVADLKQIEAHETAILQKRTLNAQQQADASQLYQYLLSAIGLALMVLAGFAALAVRRSVEAERRIRNELRRIAMTDELTGLANRREFMASLERAMASARRNRRPLSLALLDIDHFKRVNDNYGHPSGDAVIRSVALTAVDIMRGQDTVGRIGGEEFAIVLPDCSGTDAFAACERLRLAIREADLEMETGDAISVTLSTGIATFSPNDSPETIIARADAALYDAKNGGRDQVLLAA